MSYFWPQARRWESLRWEGKLALLEAVVVNIRLDLLQSMRPRRVTSPTQNRQLIPAHWLPHTSAFTEPCLL